MLKRIRRDQIRSGMFIHAIEGSWFSHPFMKAGFLLTEADDVAALRTSRADAVVIDTERGVDVDQPPKAVPVAAEAAVEEVTAEAIARQAATAAEDAPPEATVVPLHTPGPAPSATEPADGPCSLAEEFGRASRIAENAKLVMTELYDQARLGRIVEAEMLVPLVDEIAASIARNQSALTSILRLKSKDEYTYVHSVAVAALMINLGREVGGFDRDSLRDAGVAGLLHDIGKMAMPAEVLGKPGDLTSAEYSIMKTHTERGHHLLSQSRDVPEMAFDVCLHHHERINGTGYPKRLKGSQITLVARMGAVCDVYDALTSNRPYKEAWVPNMALKTMFGSRGHFDPDILTAFIRSVGIYPVGTVVRLRSEHLAVVTDVNPADLTRPVVRIFFSIAKQTSIAPQDVNLLTDAVGDAIVSSENPEDWGLQGWEGRWGVLAA
ncbi:HD-GYP domain-containing protein [Sphingosinicella xenopeptidilytica]|uniref:HD-GYP domain-containing protein n=1 Tax=Sphingosinicella xenopeptidilytica TaxID=364098 RepID=A0ABW3C0B2_SPHXN